MSRRNFNHSLYAPFTPYCHPDNSKEHYHKKIKHEPSNLNEYAYFSHANKLPVFKNPNTISQAIPLSVSSKSVNSHITRTNIKPPNPTLVRLANTGKLNRMLKNNKPGMMVYVPQNGDIHSLLTSNRWENYVFYRGQNYYTHLIAEFYANMEVQQRVDGIFYLSSFVGGKNVYVDHNVLNKALKLGNKPSELPCVNIFEKFVFNQSEFELFLGLFCEEDVPEGLCAREFAINFKHFLPRFQQLAILLRENILPKPNHDNFFDFVDLKVMFKIVSSSIDFNLNYVIVLNMVHAFNMDYMPHGLLLTSVFETHYIHMSRMHLNKIDYCAIDSLVQPKLSLKNCQTSHPNKIVIPSLAPKTNIYAILREEVNKLSLEVDVLKESNIELHNRIENLEGAVNKNKGKMIEIIDVETAKKVEEKLVGELVSVGTGDEMEKVYAALPDLGEDLGVVPDKPAVVKSAT